MDKSGRKRISVGDFIRGTLRWTMVGLALIIFSVVAVKTWKEYQRSKDRPAATRLFDDSVKESLKIRLDASRNLFQVGLLLAGGLWALYLGKTEESRVDLTQLPEVVLFLLCNGCFLISFYSHYAYTERVADWINSGVAKADKIEIPDIDENRLVSVLGRQHDFFVGGCVLALLTFLSGRYLRVENHAKGHHDFSELGAVTSKPIPAHQTISGPGSGGSTKIPREG